jgi:hypothetical protein
MDCAAGGILCRNIRGRCDNGQLVCGPMVCWSEGHSPPYSICFKYKLTRFYQSQEAKGTSTRTKGKALVGELTKAWRRRDLTFKAGAL